MKPFHIVRVQDLLEPREQGLVIATNYPKIELDPSREHGRIFLWDVGRPRKFYSQWEDLYGICFHNGDLITRTREKASEEAPFSGGRTEFRNLTTGKAIFTTCPRIHGGYQDKTYCSHNGVFYIAEDVYHKEQDFGPRRYEEYKPEWHEAIFYKETKRGFEEISRVPGEVAHIASSPNGVIASISAATRGHGPNRIININTLETLHSEPIRHDYLTGADLGQIHPICAIGDDIIFPRYPHGIYNHHGEKVANFSYLEWILKKEREIQYPKERDRYRVLRCNEDPFIYPDPDYKAKFRHLEKIAEEQLGYSYELGVSAHSDYRRDRMNEKEYNRGLCHKKTLFARRIALERFMGHRFNTWHIAYFNGNLILASNQNIYAIPFPENYHGKPIDIDPKKHKLWTFQDNIVGLEVVEGDELRKMKGQVSVRSGRKASSISFARAKAA